MVQKTFGIYSDDLEGCNLVIETGDNYIAGWCNDTQANTVKAFELFSFTEADAADFEKLFKETQWHSRLLTATFNKVVCIWGHHKAVCIPADFYTIETAPAYMELMFGSCDEEILCNNVDAENVILSLKPSAASKEIAKNNLVAADLHKYCQLVKGQQNGTQENKVHLVFYHTHFIISVYKQGRLQLIQSNTYTAAGDVLYAVLNALNKFEMPVSETNIYAGGLIDTTSPLYALLHSYLDHFSFEPVDKALYAAEGFHEHPLHYFASFCQYDV